MIRVALYLRQSRDARGDGLAVERQEKSCEAHAAGRGWTVVRTYQDNDVSASSAKPRPAFEQMMKDCELGEFDIVLSWALDRLTRKVVEIERLINWSDKTGVKFATVNGDLDLTNDQGKLIGRILGSVAMGEVERKSARQRAANTQSAAAGRIPSVRSFGYLGKELHPAEAAALRDAYSSLLAGDTLVGITKRLSEEFTSVHGRALRRTTVRQILTNPKNAGIRVAQGLEVGPGDWPAIVTEETFRAALALLDDPSRNHGQSRSRRWIGGSLYRCGKCGGPMKVIYRNGGSRAYQCRDSRHFTRTRADQIDALVETLIAERLRLPDAADLVAGSGTENTAALRLEAAGLRARIDQLGLDYAEGLLTGPQVQTASKRLQEKLDAVNDQLARAGRTRAAGSVLSAPDPGQAFLDSPVAVRQKIVAELAEITLLPVQPGARGFAVDGTIRVDWK